MAKKNHKQRMAGKNTIAQSTNATNQAIFDLQKGNKHPHDTQNLPNAVKGLLQQQGDGSMMGMDPCMLLLCAALAYAVFVGVRQ